MSLYDSIQQDPMLFPWQKELLCSMLLNMQCQNVMAMGTLAPSTQTTFRGIDRDLHQSKWQRELAYERGEGNGELPAPPAAQVRVDRERHLLYDVPVDELPNLWKR